MKKVVVKEDVFEQVKTSTVETEAWETSDGQIFNDERVAESHEFYSCKVNHRGHTLPTNIDIFDFASVEDLTRYEEDYCYNTDIFNYDKTELNFPETYVIHERVEHGDSFGEDDVWSDYTTYTDIYTLKEWKELMINGIKSVK